MESANIIFCMTIPPLLRVRSLLEERRLSWALCPHPSAKMGFCSQERTHTYTYTQACVSSRPGAS